VFFLNFRSTVHKNS